MTDKEIKELYKQTYCSKEAGWAGSLFKPLRNLGSKAWHWMHPNGIGVGKATKWVGGQMLKHPILGLGALGAAGFYGHKAYNDYKQAQLASNPLYKFSEWAKENPELLALGVGGVLTAPFWLPPTIRAITGQDDDRNGMRYGPATNRYQMGYYPGR